MLGLKFIHVSEKSPGARAVMVPFINHYIWKQGGLTQQPPTLHNLGMFMTYQFVLEKTTSFKNENLVINDGTWIKII